MFVSWRAALVLPILLVCAPTRGAEQVASTIQAAWQAAADALQTGPRTIVLGDQAAIELPDGYGFVPKEQASRLMDAWGNRTDERFLGMLLPLADEGWF